MKAKQGAAAKLKVLKGGKPGAVARRSLGALSKGEAVAESTRFEVLFENANDAILVVDLQADVVVNANNAMFELTGYLRDELVGRPASVLFPKREQVPQYSHGLNKLHLENSGFFEDIVLISKDS